MKLNVYLKALTYRMKNIIVILTASLFYFYGFSQNDKSIALQQVALRGEVYFSCDLKQVNSSKSNFSVFSFDKIKDGRIYFYSDLKGVRFLNSHNYNYKIEPIPSMLTRVNMASSVSGFTSNWDAYPTYQQYDSLMHQFAVDYPNICKLHVLGTLNSGREIIALQISDNVSQNENEVRFLYTSSMHGDEVTGYVMMLRLINYLLTNYSSDPQLYFMINNMDIWINPLANPDGTYYSGNSTVFGATRYNANSVDINRNFPDPEDGIHPDNKIYQPETYVFMAFADTMHFTMSANFHGGAEVVNYPWDTWAKLPADNTWWINVSKRFADTAQFYSPSGYMTKFGTGYINGYQWYSISGGRQDYMNYYQKCREVTIEISNTKIVAENQLPNYWNYLKHSLINYMMDATNGFHGQTTDSITHYAVKSKLTILNHDIDSSEIYSNDSGYYYRPIGAGNYNLQFSATGYYSKTYYGVSISQDSTLLLNVELVPKIDVVENSKRNYSVNVFPNPVGNIIYVNSLSDISDIKLFSVNGAKLFTWDGINSKSTKLNLSEYSAGVYFIMLNIDKSTMVKKIIIE